LKRGKLIVVSAPSGSGKTTLVRALLSQRITLTFSISATSRPPRGNEQNGKDYHFLSAADFKKKIKENDFVEFEEVYPDKFYGTLRSEVEEKVKAGQHIIFDVDVVGGLNIKNQFPDQTLALFIKAPSFKDLEKRLRSRSTESETLIDERLAKAKIELEYAPKFDRIIINDDLQRAEQEICQLVTAFLDQS
jgi:guanylate kinase